MDNKMKLARIVASGIMSAALLLASATGATADPSGIPTADSNSVSQLETSGPATENDAIEHFAEIQENLVSLPAETVEQLINTAHDFPYVRQGTAEADWSSAQAVEFEGVQLVTVPLKVETDLQVGNQLSFVFDKGEVAQVAETSLTQTGIDEYVFEMWRDGQVLIDDTFALNPSGPTIQPLGFIKRVFLNCMAKESGLTSAVSSRVYAACSAVCFAGPYRAQHA